MNIKSSLIKSVKQLSSKKIKSPHLEAELLLSKTLNKPREFILVHPEHELTTEQTKLYNQFIKKRINGWPIAYLVGDKEFYGLTFFVNNNVLIPRPETELIINEVFKIEKQNNSIIDIGTGSGCIVITLAVLLKNKKINFFASDISEKALYLAQKNAKRYNVNNQIKFNKSDLLDIYIKRKYKFNNLIIIANLPYLTKDQIKNADSIKKEPKLALDGGKDGLDYYRKLLQQVKELIYKNLYLLMEIDPSQKKKISSLIKKELPNLNLIIKKDFKKHSRLVISNN
jgi:release factor glutamine methyltransferase